MWFKNLMLFRLDAPWTLTPAALEEKLARQPLQPCTGQNLRSRGWVAPRDNGQLVYAQERHLLVALGTEEKLLPPAVVNDTLKERAALLEQQKGFPLGRKQKRELKEQIITELTPRAFARRRQTRAWIDTASGLVAIDSAVPPRAEELLVALRDALGELPLSPLRCEPSMTTRMTNWLVSGGPPGRFALDDECELTAGDPTKPTIRYLRHSLDGKEIPAHIAAGKSVTRLALSWNSRVSFVVTDKLLIKRVNFLDIDNAREAPEQQDPDLQFELDFGLMTGELGSLVSEFENSLLAG